MKTLIYTILAIALLSACKKESTSDNEVLINKDGYLYKDQYSAITYCTVTKTSDRPSFLEENFSKNKDYYYILEIQGYSENTHLWGLNVKYNGQYIGSGFNMAKVDKNNPLTTIDYEYVWEFTPPYDLDKMALHVYFIPNKTFGKAVTDPTNVLVELTPTFN